ncbi:GTP-binding protein [Pseudoalteromonas phenolica]|uniref:GTP-binding protein n=1 Tax=Pseudoalteromonas phenolica TaxID=161398 RepID=A0A4Q7IJ99_9GAMM|nr:GTP-binding protein [Pseudoalteromonas phenolica]
MATTGSSWSKIFDMQNRKFTAVTCVHCTYTEFYKSSTSTLGNVFDLFTN